MAAIGVKKVASPQELAAAGISPGDVVWARSVRNSTLLNRSRFDSVRDRVQSFIQGRQNHLAATGS